MNPKPVGLPIYCERIREGRRRLDITQIEASARCGAHPSQWAQWENGHRKPFADTMAKIADVLGVSLDWLTGRTDKPEGNDVATIAALLRAMGPEDRKQAIRVLQALVRE